MSHSRVLMLGKGWFPAQLGGLDRYYRDLLENLAEASGVVIGPAEDAPSRVRAVSTQDAPLPVRCFRMWQAAGGLRDAADVIDAHFALYSIAPVLLGRLRSMPLVVHFQGPWADENVAAGDASQWHLGMRRWLERAVYRRAGTAIVLSSASRRVLVERYRASPWRVRVEPPGVNLERFSPGSREEARRRLDLDTDAFVVVCVRRLEARMGLDVLLDAWKLTLDRLPPGASLLICGEGALANELAARVVEHGISDSVRLLGRVDNETLVATYRAADVAVVPTRSHEGFGLVVIEAAACGTPTIVTDAGGLPEAVAGLGGDLVVALDDSDALGCRVVRAAEGDLPDRDAVRLHAEGFGWNEVAARHRRIYADVARGSRDGRIRVVFLDHVARLSGGEIALLRLLPHLANVQPHVVLAEDGPLVPRLDREGISCEVLPISVSVRDLRKADVDPRGISPRLAFETARYVFTLARHLRRLSPDIVHSNSLKAGLYGGLAARLAGVPLVWHVRDRIAEDYLPRPAVRLTRFLIRRLAARVVCNSEATRRTVGSTTAADMQSVIADPLPASQNRAVRDKAPGPWCAGMVGRLAPWKGQDVFLRAFARAFPSGPERALIVGEALFGEGSYGESLRDLCAELEIADRVEFSGFVDDVESAMSAMDVLVHASITPEPYGQVIVEGMAAGLAVVASTEGGPREIITHGRDGLLYQPGDVAALAAVLRELRDDPARVAALGEAARSRALDFQPGPAAERLENLYRSILDGQ